MEQYIQLENIALLKKRLAESRTAVEQEMIVKLLAEEKSTGQRLGATS